MDAFSVLADTPPANSLGVLNGMLFDELMARIADTAPDTDVEGAFPEAAFGWLAEAGLLAVVLPGQPLDFNRTRTPQLLHLLKRIGSANLAVGRVYEGHINALYLIHLFASAARRLVRRRDGASASGTPKREMASAFMKPAEVLTGWRVPKP